jgi:nucleoid-associated protein YgaU
MLMRGPFIDISRGNTTGVLTLDSAIDRLPQPGAYWDSDAEPDGALKGRTKMAATGGSGGPGALPLAGVGAAVVVVGGAVMAWLGVFDSDDMRRIVDRESAEESSVVISPSATNPVITEGLSLQPDPDASDPDSRATSDTTSDQLAEQASDVVATQIQPQDKIPDETQVEQPPAPLATAQLAEPVGAEADTLPAQDSAAAEVNADSGTAVIATPEADTPEAGGPSVAPAPAVVPVSPVETAGSDQPGADAPVKTDDTIASAEPADTQTDQAQDVLQDAQGVAEPGVAAQAPETTGPEAPVLEAPKLDLVRVDPTGQTVIAGRAAQGVQVSILLDGEVLEKVAVQSGGDFVALTSIRPSATARVISLRAEADGQQSLSESSFILAPASPVPAMAKGESTEPPASLAADAPASNEVSSEEVASDPVTSEPVTSEPVASAAQTMDAVTSNDAAPAADSALAPVANTAEESTASTTTATAEELAQTAPAAAEERSDAPSESGPVASVAPAGVATESPKATAPTDVVQEPDTNLRTAETTDLTQPDATSAGSTEEEADAEQQPAPRPEATQVAVLRADADGVVLVQPVAQQPQGKVVLDTISYSDSGEVQLAGRARADARVLVYLDNAAAGQFVAAANGSWSGGLEAVLPGVYTLRLDEVNAAGKVLSRLETPFKREAPEVLRPPVTDVAGEQAAAPLVRAVTVQKGDTLWAISQERYGSGFLYVRVFAANQDAIRNPDLIYPGQVFVIPE